MGRAALRLVGTILVCAAAVAQNPSSRLPELNPAGALPPPSIQDAPASMPQARRGRSVESLKLRQDARTLAELAQTIPPAIDQAQKGVISKDLIEDLKQIEKLSRHIRRQLTP
jgi:hypothetical protein